MSTTKIRSNRQRLGENDHKNTIFLVQYYFKKSNPKNTISWWYSKIFLKVAIYIIIDRCLFCYSK